MLTDNGGIAQEDNVENMISEDVQSKEIGNSIQKLMVAQENVYFGTNL